MCTVTLLTGIHQTPGRVFKTQTQTHLSKSATVRFLFKLILKCINVSGFDMGLFVYDKTGVCLFMTKQYNLQHNLH